MERIISNSSMRLEKFRMIPKNIRGEKTKTTAEIIKIFQGHK
jgi:hypothetical protein